jgi:integrase
MIAGGLSGWSVAARGGQHEDEEGQDVQVRPNRRTQGSDRGALDGTRALTKKRIICPHVFQRRNGKPVKNFRKAWVAVCKASGCPGRIPHDFRRTAVRNLTLAGVTDTIAMAVTGHKTRAVFDRYDITGEADLDDAVVKLQSLVGTISATNGSSVTNHKRLKPAPRTPSGP